MGEPDNNCNLALGVLSSEYLAGFVQVQTHQGYIPSRDFWSFYEVNKLAIVGQTVYFSKLFLPRKLTLMACRKSFCVGQST